MSEAAEGSGVSVESSAAMCGGGEGRRDEEFCVEVVEERKKWREGFET